MIIIMKNKKIILSLILFSVIVIGGYFFGHPSLLKRSISNQIRDQHLAKIMFTKSEEEKHNKWDIITLENYVYSEDGNKLRIEFDRLGEKKKVVLNKNEWGLFEGRSDIPSVDTPYELIKFKVDPSIEYALRWNKYSR